MWLASKTTIPYSTYDTTLDIQKRRRRKKKRKDDPKTKVNKVQLPPKAFKPSCAGNAVSCILASCLPSGVSVPLLFASCALCLAVLLSSAPRLSRVLSLLQKCFIM